MCHRFRLFYRKPLHVTAGRSNQKSIVSHLTFAAPESGASPLNRWSVNQGLDMGQKRWIKPGFGSSNLKAIVEKKVQAQTLGSKLIWVSWLKKHLLL